MSKKDKHQRQFHTTPELPEQQRMTESRSFDAALSSALHQMLEAQDAPKPVKREDYPTIQLPTREKKPDGDLQKKPAAGRAEGTSSADDAVLSAFLHEERKERYSRDKKQSAEKALSATPAMPQAPATEPVQSDGAERLFPPEIPDSEDTAVLLSAIDSLLGSTEQAEELSPKPAEERLSQTEKTLPKQTEKNTPRQMPKTVVSGDTVRYTPQRDLPKEDAPADFWSEFEELKRLLGTQPPESEPLRQALFPEEKEDLQRSGKHMPSLQEKEDTPALTKTEITKAHPPKPEEKAPASKPEHKEPKKQPKHRPDRSGLKEALKREQPASPPTDPTVPSAVRQTAKAVTEPTAVGTAKVQQTAQTVTGQKNAKKPDRREREPASIPPQGRKKPERHTKPKKKESSGLRPEEACKKYTKYLGTTGTRLTLAGAATLLSLFLTLYVSLQWSFLPLAVSHRIASYILLALLLLTAALAYDVFSEALHQLKDLQFSVPVLVLAALLAVALDSVAAAGSDRIPFCTAAGLLIVLLLWDKYDGVTGILTTLRVLRDAKTQTGIVEVHDLMKGRVGLSRADGSVSDFMNRYEQPAPTRKLMRIYVPIAMTVSLGISAYLAVKVGSPFFWTASLMLLGSIPLVGILNFNRLFCILAKRLSDADAALCGWYGAETFGGDHAVFISDSDLFSQSNIKFNGIKMLARDAERVIGYAAATAKATGIALYPLFEEELQSRNARHFRAERYRFYESGGIGAEVSGDVVLMGTLDFMRRMGVHMEGGMKLRQAIYTSVNGELAAVFAIKYTPKESVRRGLAAIAENRHFQTVFTTRDFLLTPELVQDKYEITLTNPIYPSVKERIQLSEKEFKKKGKQGALLADDAFGSFADAVAGGRVLKSATTVCIILTLLNGLIGLGLMTVLTFRFGFEAATAVNLLIYQLAWLIPTLLLTGWTRRY